MLHITDTNIRQLLDPKCGATIVRPDGLQFTSLIPFVPIITRFNYPKPSNLTSNYQYCCLGGSPHGIWDNFGSTLARMLNQELAPHLPLAESIEFDDLYLTHYPESPIGVGTHRDTNCKGLVLAYVLEGTLPFIVCEDKDGKNPKEFPAQPGEIVIIRAQNVGDLPRPIHFVGRVEKPVLQFGLRQYIDPNKK